MSDPFFYYPSLLQGMPKKTFAEYHSKEFLIPHICQDFEEAIWLGKRGNEIRFRDEHEDEYFGPSGIGISPLYSRLMNKKVVETYQTMQKCVKNCDEETFIKEIMRGKQVKSRAREYCRITNKDLEEYLNAITYSAWINIPGLNRLIFADPVNRYKFHIITQGKQRSETILNYSTYNQSPDSKNRIQDFGIFPLRGLALESIPELVRMYKLLLETLEPCLIPLMEAQTSIEDGKTYLLQNHYSQTPLVQEDIGPVTKIPEDATRINWCRGATIPDENIFESTIVYAGRFDRKKWKINGAKASWENGHGNLVFREIISRHRDVVLINDRGNNENLTTNLITNNHNIRTPIIKPPTSISLDINSLIPENEMEILERRAQITGEDQKIFLEINADGENGWVRRVA